VFIVCDRGDRYLSTGVFPSWVHFVFVQVVQHRWNWFLNKKMVVGSSGCVA
jgi:hypothetical protein